ncbi:hypothetical protein SAY86_005162 [Trapa natans]|uniref:FLZ-type domain-containing protein n=1 Tax=Trapa natans TaxID=22666 RepID=A0AAN7L2Z3_TRANT|nr:hypothetical protein SAY86_005162 [Trapa natans]
MMLRNRSRTVFGKQSPLVADHPRSSQPSPPTQNHRRNGVSSWLGSTSGGFSPSSRFCSETTKTMMSPALFLDVRRVSALRTHPPVRPPEGKKRSWQDFESQGGIGLAIVGNMFNKVPEKNGVKPNRNLVLYGLTIRTSIPSPPPPPPPPVSTFGPLEYPSDFRENSRNSRHPQGLKSSSRPLTECLSVREMELSEDYTCITFHGPNGRTTHIFDDCVVEKNYFSVLPHKPKPPGNVMLPPHKPKQGKQSFLNFCYTCTKRLEQSKDIYIYRGDKSFCSQECRHREILLDGANEDDP